MLSEEASFHKEELARIHEEGEDDIADVLDQPRPPKDYASRVEDLQEEARGGGRGMYAGTICILFVISDGKVVAIR